MKKADHPFQTSSFYPTLIVIIFMAFFLLGVFIPIQTDEIDLSIASYRVVYDHFQLSTLLPQCYLPGKAFTPLPLIWYPAFLIYHYIFMQVDGLLWIRLVGM